MSEGYPDYTRLSRSGNVTLFDQSGGTLPNNTILWEGYVGNFSFTTIAWRSASTADFCQVAIQYFSDSTFTTVVAFRYATRANASVAITQYANLSEWMQISIDTISGNPFPIQAVSVYGAQQPSTQIQLADMSAPIVSQNGHVAATNSLDVFPGQIYPGNAVFTMLTGAASWSVNFLYYNWFSAAWITLFQVGSTAFTAKYFSQNVPMLDAPAQVQFFNNDATSQNFLASWQVV